MMCYVCGRGFDSAEAMTLHLAKHPGRSDAELKRAHTLKAEMADARTKHGKAVDDDPKAEDTEATTPEMVSMPTPERVNDAPTIEKASKTTTRRR